MKALAATLFLFGLLVAGAAAGEQAAVKGASPMWKSEDVRAVAPAL